MNPTWHKCERKSLCERWNVSRTLLWSGISERLENDLGAKENLLLRSPKALETQALMEPKCPKNPSTLGDQMLHYLTSHAQFSPMTTKNHCPTSHAQFSPLTTKNVYNHMDTSSHIDKLCHLGSPVTPSLRRACPAPRHNITNHCTKEYLYTFVIFYILFVHIARIKKQPYSVWKDNFYLYYVIQIFSPIEKEGRENDAMKEYSNDDLSPSSPLSLSLSSFSSRLSSLMPLCDIESPPKSAKTSKILD